MRAGAQRGVELSIAAVTSRQGVSSQCQDGGGNQDKASRHVTVTNGLGCASFLPPFGGRWLLYQLIAL
jgi:hypothetical protein